MRCKASNVVSAAGPDAVNVQRARSAASPDVARQDVRERYGRVVRRRVSHPQTAVSRDDDVARRHRASVARLLAHAAIRRGAHRRVIDQRAVVFLEEVGDAVERSARPVAGRYRRSSAPAPVGQFNHGVGAV